MQLKETIKRFLPPIILEMLSNVLINSVYEGNYRTWDDAFRTSGGYDSDVILKKVKDSLLKVKSGEANCERDSVLFDKVQYSWPLLAGLLWIASQEDNNLNLVDFGGSLGSSYYQNKKFLEHLRVLRWNIVEQKNFVECGKQYFEGEHLKFYYSLDDCIKEQQPDTILLSSVIQYLEKPHDLLRDIIGKRFKYILFDRTPFLSGREDRITVQKVPQEIYRASYPAWFFNEDKFLGHFSRDYDLISDFESNDRANIQSVFKGFIFKLRET
jgi:putative methyltransferase (TIGR04325 family)